MTPTALFVFVAGATFAVAVQMLAAGIREDRRAWRELDAVQADIQARYPADPAGMDKRHSVWTALASRGELAGFDDEPPTPPAAAPPPWKVLNLADLTRRATRATAQVDSPADPLQPLIWSPTSPGRHRVDIVDGSAAQAAGVAA